jgi:hypothetical protein
MRFLRQFHGQKGTIQTDGTIRAALLVLRNKAL